MSPRDPFLSAAAIAAALALTSCGSAEDELPQDDPTEQSAEQAGEATEPADADASAAPRADEDADEAPDEADTDDSDATTNEPADDEASGSEADADTDSEADAETDSGTVDLSRFSTQLQASEDFNDFQFDVSHDTMQVLNEVRLGSHEGYERIVLEYALDTDLAHQAQYIEPGSQAESFTGGQDDTTGAMLLIDVLGTTGGPEAEAAAWTESWTPETEEAMVREIQPGELLGGQSQVLISLDEQRDFQVQQLDDPVRIVLDIAQD